MTETTEASNATIRDAVPLVCALAPEAVARAAAIAKTAPDEIVTLPLQEWLNEQWLETGPAILAEALFELARVRQIRDIVPPIVDASQSKRPLFSTRLERRCQQHGIETWEHIADLRLADVLTWEGAGRKTAVELLAAAIRMGMRMAAAIPIPKPQTDHHGSGGRATDFEGPPDDELPPPLDPVALAMELLSRFPARERRILLSRFSCTLERGPTLVELGSEFGVTRQRIEQIEKRTYGLLQDTLEQQRYAYLAEHVATLKAVLGVICHVVDVPDELRPALTPFSDQDDAGAVSTLFLALAGPYDRHHDWLVRSDTGRLDTTLLESIRAAMRGGLLSITELEPLVGRFGLRRERWRTWAAHQPSLRVLDDAVADWRGSQADKAELILRHRGAPLTDQEIFSLIDEPISLRGLRNRILADSRFIRRDKKRFGLAEWGGDEYISIQTAMLEALDSLGGEGRVADLIDAITARFPDAVPNSIRSYADSALFVRTAPGTIRARRATEPYVSTQRIELERDCFRLGEHWALRVRITSDHLRGSGFAIPEAFATAIGLRPSSVAEFASDNGAISAGWRGQPYLGSIRPSIETLGLIEGDYVFVSCIPPARILFRPLRLQSLSEAPHDQRAKLLVGAEGDDSDTVSVVGYAVGLLSPSQQTLTEIRSRLQQKRAHDILALLPETAQPPSMGPTRVRSLIESDESTQLEYKSTFEWDLRQNRHNPGLHMMVVKTIAAFLNSDGGDLLIGVGDDRDIVGLEHDYAIHKDGRDKFELHMTNVLSSHFGPGVLAALAKSTFVQIDGREICHINVTASQEPIYIKKGGSEDFYIRVGNQTRALTPSEAGRYIATHFYRGPLPKT